LPPTSEFTQYQQNMNNTPAIALVIASLAATTAFADIDVNKLPPAAAKKGVTYATDIKPILEASCVRCHGSERPKAGLRLDSLENLLKGSKEGPVVTAGNSVKSPLLIAVSQLDPELSMPPKPGRGGGRGGPGGPGGQWGRGGPGGQRGTNAPAGAVGQRPPGGPGGPGGGQPPKPLTPEQVGLVRAWIDQGAK
jgi:mono/diheme cytochrome c family protein